MITTLLFDLDGVILNFLKAEDISLKNTIEGYGIPFNAEVEATYHRINRHLWDEFEKGTVTKDRVTLGRFKDFLEAIGEERDYIQMGKDYQNGLAYCYYLYEDAYEVLERLAKKYRLYAVTNGVSFTAYNRLRGTDTLKFFNDVFVSEDLGAQKPSLEYFDQVIERIGDLNKEETILIGDSLTSDIQGAKNMGVRSVYLNRLNLVDRSPIIPDYMISNLYELEELLTKLS